MTTLYLEQKKAPDLFAGLQYTVDPQEFKLVGLPLANRTELDANDIGLIPWFSLRPGAFIRELSTVWRSGLRRLVVVSPAQGKKPWNEPELNLPAHLRAAFDEAVGSWDEPTLDGLRSALGQTHNSREWAHIRIKQYAEARILYDECLYKFSHGSRMDLSNQFLAPARLLLSGGESPESDILAEWKEVWEGKGSPFVSGQLGELTKLGGATGEELAETAKRITVALDNALPHSPTLADIESVMQQITRIRETAALKSRSDVTGNSEWAAQAAPVGTLNESKGYRILVVDDHSAAWRPVFEKLAKNLQSGGAALPVRFDFSTDGSKVWYTDGQDAPLLFGQYDLVILDVFLGSKRGTAILERLRRDFAQLPVLLWTTSRDEEITAEATLANGILLKKTVTWDQLEGAVRTWAPHGKAMRTTTLPNPFFNHAIKNLEYRKLAVDFHEWCLKQLDSFHALDNEFFRYFTDHGGRHIVKFWELLERALQPFLHDDTRLLPDKPHEREIELLGLYLAVICHELGMFPMRIGGQDGAVENFSRVGREYLNDVRALHAARGMVLLADDNPVDGGVGMFWNDRRGRELAKALRGRGNGLALRLAVLVGYHARLFQSLKRSDFLKWNTAGVDLGKKLYKLGAPTPVLFRGGSAFEAAFRSLMDAIPVDDAMERLRRQCALFRFVDALDITASRNPADFLIGSNELPAKQYGENLKREICEKAGIDSGDTFVVMCVRPPEKGKVQQALDYVFAKTLMAGKDHDLAETALRLVGNGRGDEIIATPWKLPDKEIWNSASWIDENSVKCLQKPLDRWLEEFWKALLSPVGNADFISHLRKTEILDPNSQDPRLLFQGAETVAGLTALSVAGELLDEYRAIADADLQENIRLPGIGVSESDSQKGFVWRSKPWEDGVLPSSLISFGRFLPKDQLKGFEQGG